MQGIFLRNLCMKQKGRRLRSILCSASFAVDDWKIFLISREGVILLYDTTKKDCCTDVQQSFLMRFQQKLLIIQQRLHQWGKHPRKHRNRCRNQRSQLQRRSRW
jgi:hypothetical protein